LKVRAQDRSCERPLRNFRNPFATCSHLGFSGMIEQTNPTPESVKTTLTEALDKEQALAAIHDYEFLIKLNPRVEKYQRMREDEATYEITDTLEVMGLAFLQTYTSTFTPQPDGVTVKTTAGMGLSIEGRWIVESDETAGMVKISEISEITCHWIMRAYVLSQIKWSHLQIMEAFHALYKVREVVDSSETDLS